MIDACSAPAVVLTASYVGFGSLVHQNGFGLDIALLSTFTSWALPGQVLLIELYAVGSSLTAIFLAVTLTNVRFLPMTISILPILRVPGRAAWKLYASAHFITVTGWAGAMARGPDLPAEQRLSYFIGFVLFLFGGSLIGTAVGYFLAGAVPGEVSLGLVFLNPIYFLLIFFVDMRRRGRMLALGLGALSGPLLHQVSPTWGLLASGVLAGSAAFLIDAALARRERRLG